MQIRSFCNINGAVPSYSFDRYFDFVISLDTNVHFHINDSKDSLILFVEWLYETPNIVLRWSTVVPREKNSYLSLLSPASGQRSSRREANQLREKLELGWVVRAGVAGQGQINPDQVTP